MLQHYRSINPNFIKIVIRVERFPIHFAEGRAGSVEKVINRESSFHINMPTRKNTIIIVFIFCWME